MTGLSARRAYPGKSARLPARQGAAPAAVPAPGNRPRGLTRVVVRSDTQFPAIAYLYGAPRGPRMGVLPARGCRNVVGTSGSLRPVFGSRKPMKIYFCEKCGISIPLQEVVGGRAT